MSRTCLDFIIYSSKVNHLNIRSGDLIKSTSVLTSAGG